MTRGHARASRNVKKKKKGKEQTKKEKCSIITSIDTYGWCNIHVNLEIITLTCIYIARVVCKRRLVKYSLHTFLGVFRWTAQFDSKFREFSYKIPRIDVSNRRMIFSISCCPSRDAVDSIRDMLFENLYEIAAKHTWPEKAECDQICMSRMDYSFADGRLTFSCIERRQEMLG